MGSSRYSFQVPDSSAGREHGAPTDGGGPVGAGDGQAPLVSGFDARCGRVRVDGAAAVDRMRHLVADPDPRLMMLDRLTGVLLPAVCDAVKVDLFTAGRVGGVRFARSTADGHAEGLGDRTEPIGDAPHGWDGSDGAAGPFLGPDRVTARFATHPATPPLGWGFVVCRWDDGYAPTAADATLVQSVVDAAVLLLDRERLAEQLRVTSDRAENLQVAVESNRRIGAAVGILMARRALTATQAFRELARVSSITNTKLRVVADTVVRTGDLPAPRRSPPPAHHGARTPLTPTPGRGDPDES
jgi:hypothetical protein